MASQTLRSGKINEFIGVNAPKAAAARGGNQRRVKFEAAGGARGGGFLNDALNARQYELARRATTAGGGLMKAAVEVARHVQRGADGITLHKEILTSRRI